MNGTMRWDMIKKINDSFYEIGYEKDSENHFYKTGLMLQNDQAYDLFQEKYLKFEIESERENSFQIDLWIARDQIPNPEYPVKITANVASAKTGRYRLDVSMDQFSLADGERAWLKFAKRVELHGEFPFYLYSMEAKKGRMLNVEMAVRGKAAQAGEYAVYQGRVENLSEEAVTVNWSRRRYGWEAVRDVRLPEPFLLKAGETSDFVIEVKMEERVAPGGFEKQRICIAPDRFGGDCEELELTTARALAHPSLIMNREELTGVKEKIKRGGWAALVYDSWLDLARDWKVPELDPDKPYCFVSKNANAARGAAVMYDLSGDRNLALKVVDFLKKFSDPEEGYLKKRYGCNQELVHEGEFFKNMAIAYDLVYNMPELTAKDHENLEAVMRCFTEYIDWELQKGGISNWTLLEAAGALYCSCVLQDRERMERFLYGIGGAAEHLRIGTMSDGWWYEASIGYNLLCAGAFSEISQVVSHFGIDFAHIQLPACYSGSIQSGAVLKDGLANDIWGPNDKCCRNIPMIWDSLAKLYDYRGVAMGVNDSSEMHVEGISHVLYDSRFDLAYYLYKKPEYAALLRQVEPLNRDLLFGAEELPETDYPVYRESSYADNGGLAILRSRKKGVLDREQISVGLKYGSHGGAHGHYDRASMTGLMRYGRSLTNPENVWYSYATMMYKFYVQNSVAHNMVTVDLKQQDPREPKRILFYSGEMMQVCALENRSRWCNPPYGGWQCYEDKSFPERCFHEGRYVPVPKDPPEYSSRSGFTEEVVTRRLCMVTDDYIVLFDCAEGGQEHDYDCLFHLQGFCGSVGLRQTGWSEKLTDDPLSSGQFITDCSHYETETGAKLQFHAEYTDTKNNGNEWLTKNRTGYNEYGELFTDLYLIAPERAQVVIGSDPEYEHVNKDLYYQVLTDGTVREEGAFGSWILGREEVDIDISGCMELELRVKVEDVEFEPFIVYPSRKTVFWGNPEIVLEDGTKIPFSLLHLEYENTDQGNGIGTDYYGGPVKLQAVTFENSVPAEPEDRSREGVIRISLEGLKAVRFHAFIGGDYPLGDEEGRRRTVAWRHHGKSAAFISVMETYEKEPQITGIGKTPDGEGVAVSLRDGRIQEIYVTGLQAGKPKAAIYEKARGTVIRCEYDGSREEKQI